MPCQRALFMFVVFAFADAAGAQNLGQVLTNLDNKALSAGWMDNYVDGVLHDQGWAAHAMPDTYPTSEGIARVDGGGYFNALRRLRADSTDYATRITASAFEMTPAELTNHANTYFAQHYSELYLADFTGVYDAGTSFAVQGMVFAPVKAGNGYGFWSYPELHSMTQAAGSLSLYGNIGFANNRIFYQGEWEHNVRYGQQRREIDPAWGLVMSATQPTAVPTTTYVEQRQPADGSPKPYLHAIMDGRHPEVLPNLLASIRDAIDKNPTMKFYVAGEYGLAVPDCGNPQDCIEKAPLTGYSDRSMSAFRTFLQELYVTPAALNAAWHTTGLEFHQVQPADIKSHAQGNYQPILDFKAYLDEQRSELDLLQYTTAKAHAPAGTYGLLKAGRPHIEDGWLHSDFPLSLNWYSAEDKYFGAMGHFLYHEAAAMRLAGRPGAFGITSPATSSEHAGGCVITPTPFPFTQRCLSKNHTRLLVHDILSSGHFHIGYYKVVGGFATYGTVGAQEVMGEMQYLKSIRDSMLRFTTPYQRVHVHLDSAKFGSLAIGTAARTIARKLESHHAPYSMFSDRRVLERRMFPRNMVRRGTVISPFHADLTAGNFALWESYRALAGGASPRPAVGVFVDLPTAVALNGDNRMAGLTYIGSVGASTLVWQDLTNLFFVFVFDQQTPSEIHSAVDALILANPVEPARALVTDPVQSIGSRVHVNFVSDGLNFFAALSNRDKEMPATVTTLSVHQDVANRFQGAVSSWVPDVAGPYSLAPRETRFIYLRAVVPGQYGAADIASELGTLQTQLNARTAEGYDTATAQRLLDHANTIHGLGSYPERVIAAMLRLRKMMLLNVSRSAATLTIAAKRIDGTVVVGAPIQIEHLANGRFEQDAGTTTAAPKNVTIAQSTTPRWDFVNLQWSVPAQNPATDPVEVHVADPMSGAHAFVSR